MAKRLHLRSYGSPYSLLFHCLDFSLQARPASEARDLNAPSGLLINAFGSSNSTT